MILRRRSLGLATALGLAAVLLASVGPARADTLSGNDPDITVEGGERYLDLTEGVAGRAVTLQLDATDQAGDTVGCNATAFDPVSFAINTPAGVTASSPNLVFAECGAAGAVPITFTAACDSAGGLVAFARGGGGQGVVAAIPAQFTVRITPTAACGNVCVPADNVIGIFVDDAQPVTEGDGAPAQLSFPVRLGFPTSCAALDITVRTTNAGTATAGVDFTVTQTVVRIPQGSLLSSFSVPVIGDGVQELNETVAVEIVSYAFEAGKAPDPAFIENPNGALGTIVDDDFEPVAACRAGAALPNGYKLIQGTAGNDRITGTSAAEVIRAGGGDDVIAGGSGNDILCGSSGNDQITDASGTDTLSGGNGNDDLRAGSGNDLIYGGNGADRLDGGSGTDRGIDSDAGTTRISIEKQA